MKSCFHSSSFAHDLVICACLFIQEDHPHLPTKGGHTNTEASSSRGVFLIRSLVFSLFLLMHLALISFSFFLIPGFGTYLVAQWLRLHTPNAGIPGSIPSQGTTSHMPQLKILHAVRKTHCSQINK